MSVRVLGRLPEDRLPEDMLHALGELCEFYVKFLSNGRRSYLLFEITSGSIAYKLYKTRTYGEFILFRYSTFQHSPSFPVLLAGAPPERLQLTEYIDCFIILTELIIFIT